MLVIDDRKHFDAVVAFAKTVGLYDTETDCNGALKSRLTYLERFTTTDGTRVRLFRDFAPYSFGFRVERMREGEWCCLFEGGLIFHGAHDGNGSGARPTFSTTVTPTVGWSIHT